MAVLGVGMWGWKEEDTRVSVEFPAWVMEWCHSGVRREEQGIGRKEGDSSVWAIWILRHRWADELEGGIRIQNQQHVGGRNRKQE